MPFQLLHTGRESSTQPCTELPPTPIRDQSQQSSWVWGFFFFSSFHQQGGNPAGTFPHYIFHWRQVSLVMQETDMKARLISALPSTLGSTVSQRKEKRDFCFPTPDFPSPFCCSHWHCANPRIHIHHLKRQLKKSRTCKCGPFKKTGQEVLLEHSWMAFFNSRATPSWEQCPHGAFL